MKVEIEEIMRIHDRLGEINSEDLSNIVFTLNGEEVDINPKHIKDFKFVGLNNVDFIRTEFYKNGFDDE